MTRMINGTDVSETILENLAMAIVRNNEVTEEQKRLLVKYTRFLCWLTITIGVIALLQLAAMVWK